jgi:hypothetical protein
MDVCAPAVRRLFGPPALEARNDHEVIAGRESNIELSKLLVLANDAVRAVRGIAHRLSGAHLNMTSVIKVMLKIRAWPSGVAKAELFDSSRRSATRSVQNRFPSAAFLFEESPTD